MNSILIVSLAQWMMTGHFPCEWREGFDYRKPGTIAWSPPITFLHLSRQSEISISINYSIDRILKLFPPQQCLFDGGRNGNCSIYIRRWLFKLDHSPRSLFLIVTTSNMLCNELVDHIQLGNALYMFPQKVSISSYDLTFHFNLPHFEVPLAPRFIKTKNHRLSYISPPTLPRYLIFIIL